MARPTRLEPSPFHANYIHLRALAAQLRRALTRLGDRSGLAVVDVGCGDRPYEPLFAGRAEHYIGVDYRPAPKVDVVAPAEKLPLPDGSFDIFLSTQVLEHAEDPEQAVAEAARLLRPGGLALVSTHGVVNYHPNPDDYWRWTHSGLIKLFANAGEWRSIDVWPNGGTASALAYLFARQIEVIGGKLKLLPLLRPGIFALNVVAWRLDRFYVRFYPGRPVDLSVNYLVVAERA